MERLIKFQLKKVIEESSIQLASFKCFLAKKAVINQLKKGWKLRPILRLVPRDPLTDPYLYTIDRFIILNHRPDSFKSNWCGKKFNTYYENARKAIPLQVGYFDFNKKDIINYKIEYGIKRTIEDYLEALNEYGGPSIPYMNYH
jgi:hypothetical protein